MKKFIFVFALFAAFAVNLSAQNLTTVSGSNITDINGSKLAAGQVCFLITDQSDQPISVSIGGGGQALKRGYCSAVTAGVVTSFTVPNPANTSPTGIYYRVTVKDSSTGQEVLRYVLVSFTGATFNFDNYAPTNLAQGAPLSGTTVSGNLSGNGNATFTGTVTGSNIPSSIIQQIFSAGIGQTQRTGGELFFWNHLCRQRGNIADRLSPGNTEHGNFFSHANIRLLSGQRAKTHAYRQRNQLIAGQLPGRAVGGV